MVRRRAAALRAARIRSRSGAPVPAAWPIGYPDLDPYYDAAEQRLGVRVFSPETDLTCDRAAHDAQARPAGRANRCRWRCRRRSSNTREEAAHFDAFASVKGLKADAESGCSSIRIAHLPNLRLHSGDAVGATARPTQRTAAACSARHDRAAASIFEGRTVLLAAGALHSPRLLQQYLTAHRTGARACRAPRRSGATTSSTC